MSKRPDLAVFAGPNVVPFRPRNGGGRAWKVQAKSQTEGEVWVYGDIGDSWFSESITAKEFAEALKALGPVDTLNVYINSPGGSVFEGVAIGTILSRHRAKKIVHIDGLAASIASVIAMAGNEIRIARNGLIMIHNPWGVGVGEAKDLRKMADSLDKIREAIIDTYVVRTGGDTDVISDQMDAETWFNAEEALAAGFADAISEPVEIAAFAGVKLDGFRHAPADLRAAAAKPAEPPQGEAPPATPDQTAARGPHALHPHVARAEARLRRRGLLDGA